MKRDLLSLAAAVLILIALVIMVWNTGCAADQPIKHYLWSPCPGASIFAALDDPRVEWRWDAESYCHRYRIRGCDKWAVWVPVRTYRLEAECD